MLGRKELTKGNKLRVVTAVVIPTLTYTDVKLEPYRQGTRDTNGYADEGVMVDRRGCQDCSERGMWILGAY